MAFNEKIRTPDVVEILDVKIKTASLHVELGVPAGETYDLALDALEGQIPSLAQKAAFDAAISTPSAANPVVLKDDIPTYYPDADLGELKDSVDDVVDLPLIGNAIGDVRPVINVGALYRWNGLVWSPFVNTGTLDHTQLTNQDGAFSFQHLTQAEKTSLLAQTHTHANKPILDLVTAAGSGQIITAAERSRLPTQGEKDALQGTQGTPSITNRYVTSQDPRLNTLKNPYVTIGNDPSASYPGIDIAPFLEAVKGISDFACTVSFSSPTFVTVSSGHVYLDNDVVFFRTDPSDPLAVLPGGILPEVPYFVQNATGTDFNISETFAGPLVDTTDSGAGLFTVFSNNAAVKALEVLPQTYFMGGLGNNLPLVWDKQESGMLLEALTPFGAVLNWQTFTDSLQILGPGIGPVIVRGLVFNLDAAGTNGILVERDYCVIEDCHFIGQTSLAQNHVALTINADHVVVRRCKFVGELVSGVVLNGSQGRLEECEFDLSSPLSSAVIFDPLTSNTKISSCDFKVGTLNIQGSYTQVQDCSFGNSAVVVDLGSGTRLVHAPTADPGTYVGQPFAGTRRTIGPLGSLADYRGNTEAVFTQAFADPLALEFDLLQGTYTLASTVTVPSGVKLRGVTQDSGAVFIQGTSGVTMFAVGSDVTVENIDFNVSSAPILSIVGSNVLVRRCALNLSGPDSFDDFSVYCQSSVNVRIVDCDFTGVRGVYFANSEECYLVANRFSTVGTTFESNDLDGSHIQDNHFLSGACIFDGDAMIVTGNHFLGALPSKALTSSSTWQGNYPSPQANNYAGVDYLDISLDKYLESVLPGCFRASVLDFGTLAFAKTDPASAVTLPIKLGGALDTTETFEVTLRWTANASSGDVQWLVGVTFKDELTATIGVTQIQTAVSSRTNLAIKEDETVTLSFPATYGIGTAPTHVSVAVTRLPFNVLDTMPTEALLLQAEIELKRI